MTSGPETEWVYFYNPGACTGLSISALETVVNYIIMHYLRQGGYLLPGIC